MSTFNMSSSICILQWFTGVFLLLLISFHCLLSFIRVAYVIWAVTCISMLFLAPCLAIDTSLFYHVSYSSTFSFLPSPLPPYCPSQMPPCPPSFHRPLCVHMHLSSLLLHMSALNLFPLSSLIFWEKDHLVWRHWGRFHKSCTTWQSLWGKPRCTADPVGVGCNRPLVCCAQLRGGNVQPAATELRQTWRRKVLVWQKIPHGTTPECMTCLGQNHFEFTPRPCNIMTFPQRGTPNALHPTAPVQPQGR